jgi:nucleoid-associated protein YgaU
MGLFDFFKGDDEDDKSASEPAGGADKAATLQQNIERTLAMLGEDAAGVSVSVAGDVATLTGRAPSQEAMEKAVLCAGNQAGIASVDCQVEVDTPAQEAAPEPVFYTVKSGDTLGKIAAAQYGDASKYPVIFEANRPMLSDPDKIYPGQALRIPPL